MENRKYCMFCKKIIPKNAEFCVNCGHDLSKIDYSHKKRCSYCNFLVPTDVNFCPICGTEIHKEKEQKRTSVFDLKSSFNSFGGNFFDKNISINVFIKKNVIYFKTFGKGECSFNIRKDFYSCERLDDSQSKNLGLDTYGRKYLVLTFNDTTLIMEDNSITEDIISYIYKNIVNAVYETDSMFFNADNDKFTLF